MYYRFKSTGTFIKAKSFQDAKEKYLALIQDEKETHAQWHNCTCLGFDHRYDCPENPYNKSIREGTK